MERKLIISDLLRKAWQSLRAQIWVLAGLVIGYTIISLLLTCTMPYVSYPGRAALGLANTFFTLVFALGYLKNLFQALDGEEPQFSAYGQMSRKVFALLFAYILYTVIVALGLVLLIVPGVYVGLRWVFAPQIIVEENAGALSSLRRSWEITRGTTGQVFKLVLAGCGIMLLGHLAFGIGIFLAIPLVHLMMCAAYRRLIIRGQ